MLLYQWLFLPHNNDTLRPAVDVSNAIMCQRSGSSMKKKKGFNFCCVQSWMKLNGSPPAWLHLLYAWMYVCLSVRFCDKITSWRCLAVLHVLIEKQASLIQWCRLRVHKNIRPSIKIGVCVHFNLTPVIFYHRWIASVVARFAAIAMPFSRIRWRWE